MPSTLSTIHVSGANVDLSPRVVVSTTVAGSPAAAAETTVATVTIPGALSTALGVIVLATCSFTVGASGVSTRFRLYHGTSSGTLIADTGLLTATAANLDSRTVLGIDTVPVLPSQVYTLTMTVGSGAAVSTVSQVMLAALAI